MRFIDKLNRHFLVEDADVDFKNPHSSSYDRQKSEDLLYHTIGPLSDSPTFSGQWTSRSKSPSIFKPGGPAPKWTKEEVITAMAGDPTMIWKGGPTSPSSGRGGSPIWRMARRLGRKYARDYDKGFIEETYQNGLLELTRLLQPGYDMAKAPFISFVSRQVYGAMQHGPSVPREMLRINSKESQEGYIGLARLLDMGDPEEVRKAANRVQGKYQTTSSNDRNPGNPFGAASPYYYQLAMNYADALESGDEESLEQAKQDIDKMIGVIDDRTVPIRGASTGIGQAISTTDRKSSVGVVSMDAPKGTSDSDEGSMAANLAAEKSSESLIDSETTNYLLNAGLYHITGFKGTKFAQMGQELGLKNLTNFGVNEFRFIIRTFGASAANYPGKGTVRTNLKAKRDSGAWWKPGEDPEIEPIPKSDELWNSIWTRNGFPSMQVSEIRDEMVNEIEEFELLGIKTGRDIKIDSKNNIKYTVKMVQITTTIKAARIKLMLVARAQSDMFGLDESKKLMANGILNEEHDAIDRQIIAEAAYAMCDRLDRMIRQAESQIARKIYIPYSRKIPKVSRDMLPVDGLLF